MSAFVQQIFNFFESNSLQLNEIASASRYCLPTQSCFPSKEVFSTFNSSISGRLIRPEVPVFPCVHSECSSDTFRESQDNSLMFVNFETGWESSNSMNSSRGRTPEYVVKAIDINDIVSTVNFARENRLRLRIKSTGHDYLGRSSEEGSLTLWTHHMKNVSYSEFFSSHLSPSSYEPSRAITLSAGVQMRELYEVADNHGVIVTGGVSKSIGIGYFLGGGHGPLAPFLGLACDNILEFSIVLASGELIKVSEFSHPDLFRSLKGGGGAFGAVVEVVLKAHLPPTGFIGVFGTFKIDSQSDSEIGTETWKEIIRKWIQLQPILEIAGFAGYSYIRKPQETPFAYILPSDNIEAAKLAFSSFFEYLESRNDVIFTYNFVEEKSFYKLWIGDFQRALLSLDAVGINLLLGGRLIPKNIVTNITASNLLADFLSSARSPSIVHLVAGGEVAKVPKLPSSVNRLWRETLLHIDVPVSWKDSDTPQKIKGIESYVHSHTQALGKLAQFTVEESLVEAAYPAEGDYFEVEWQKVWYGEENYSNLLGQKKIYDPEGVFSARRAIGSEIVGY